MADLSGSALGPYRIIEPVGTGGFATVYRGRDERFGHNVAVKVLAENHSLDPAIRERFLDEARLLRRLDNPHLVRVLDIGETDHLQPYLVLTYADRGDLRRRVSELRHAGHHINDEDVVTVVGSLAAALRSMHPAGIVHRDLSPGNLLLRCTDVVSDQPSPGLRTDRLVADDERLLLADLGYAKDLSVHSGLTVGGGTRGFQAPEQRTGLGTVDTRADIYGASAVIAWLTTGVEPDRMPTQDLLQEIERRGAGDRLADVLSVGLATEPGRRQPDIDRWEQDMLDAIGPAPRAPATVDRAEDGVVATASRRAPPARVAIPVLLALAAVAGAGAVRFWPSSGSDIVELDDGRLQVIESDGSLVVSIFGPETIVVGEPAVFEAGVSGAIDYRWITPAGRVVEGTPSITITASTTGTGTVTLLATAADGSAVTVEHRFDVES